MANPPATNLNPYCRAGFQPNSIVWAINEVANAKTISDISAVIDFANIRNPYQIISLGICSLDDVRVKDIIYEISFPGLEFSMSDFPDDMKWDVCRESECQLKPFDLLSHAFETSDTERFERIREIAAKAGLKQIMVIPMMIKNTTTVAIINLPNGDFENHASECLPKIYQFTYAVFERFPKLLAWPKAGKLTPREVEVLTLSAKGLTEAAIAARCGISINTVRNHVENSKVKLNAKNKLHAVMIAAETHEIQTVLG
jgi:DNA-binding CsgD family transcriptional regulator